MSHSFANQLAIVIPSHNDWHCLRLLIPRINGVLSGHGLTAALVIVDDASAESAPSDLAADLSAISSCQVVRLRINLGHQRAIAVGLCFAHRNLSFERLLVMDADGEDRPEDILTLLRRSESNPAPRIIFAERAFRPAGVIFQTGYKFYRLMFRMLTGENIRFGNFSLIPISLLHRVIASPDLWNHYAVGLLKSRLPIDRIPCDRGKRLSGSSKMSLTSLVIHGLSAMSVYNDLIGARAFLAFAGLSAGCLGLGLLAVVVKFLTALAIPGWATYSVGLSLTISLQAFTLSIFFIFLTLHSRTAATIIPEREYEQFIENSADISGTRERARVHK